MFNDCIYLHSLLQFLVFTSLFDLLFAYLTAFELSRRKNLCTPHGTSWDIRTWQKKKSPLTILWRLQSNQVPFVYQQEASLRTDSRAKKKKKKYENVIKSSKPHSVSFHTGPAWQVKLTSRSAVVSLRTKVSVWLTAGTLFVSFKTYTVRVAEQLSVRDASQLHGWFAEMQFKCGIWYTYGLICPGPWAQFSQRCNSTRK